MEFVVGIILIASAVFLVVAVLMQSGKDHNMSGAIAGGAETFFGKSKGRTIDRVLNKLTTIVAIIFAVLVVICYIVQPSATSEEEAAAEETVVETTAAEETEAETTAVEETTVAETTSADAEVFTTTAE